MDQLMRCSSRGSTLHVRACRRACVLVCVRACVRACMRAWQCGERFRVINSSWLSAWLGGAGCERGRMAAWHCMACAPRLACTYLFFSALAHDAHACLCTRINKDKQSHAQILASASGYGHALARITLTLAHVRLVVRERTMLENQR